MKLFISDSSFVILFYDNDYDKDFGFLELSNLRRPYIYKVYIFKKRPHKNSKNSLICKIKQN